MLLVLGLRWSIGNVESINIFDDPCIPRLKTFRPISPRIVGSPLMVKDLLFPSGSWNIDKLNVFYRCTWSIFCRFPQFIFLLVTILCGIILRVACLRSRDVIRKKAKAVESIRRN